MIDTKTLAEPGTGLPARDAQSSTQADVAANAGRIASQSDAGPSPSVARRDAAEGAADGLGPLADPTPAEKALSLLRTAMDRAGIVWPVRDSGHLLLSLIAVEDAALLRSRELRASLPALVGSRSASKCDSIARAAVYVASAIRAERTSGARRSAYLVGRAEEELSWVGKADGR